MEYEHITKLSQIAFELKHNPKYSHVFDSCKLSVNKLYRPDDNKEISVDIWIEELEALGAFFITTANKLRNEK